MTTPKQSPKPAETAWTPWSGGECPVPTPTEGWVRVQDGSVEYSEDISGFNWAHGPKGPHDGRQIVAYASKATPKPARVMQDLINGIFCLQLVQMVDSAVPTTREFWRKKYFNATDAEARDPRPFVDVLRERTLEDKEQ